VINDYTIKADAEVVVAIIGFLIELMITNFMNALSVAR
jgi:hypothetical protein